MKSPRARRGHASVPWRLRLHQKEDYHLPLLSPQEESTGDSQPEVLIEGAAAHVPLESSWLGV